MTTQALNDIWTLPDNAFSDIKGLDVILKAIRKAEKHERRQKRRSRKQEE